MKDVFQKLRENKLYRTFPIVFTLSSPCYFCKASFLSLQICLTDQLDTNCKNQRGRNCFSRFKVRKECFLHAEPLNCRFRGLLLVGDPWTNLIAHKDKPGLQPSYRVELSEEF